MKALTDIVLAEGKKKHVLRNIIASHFMMNGGKTWVLQHIHGCANILETMRYAHFAPEHLEAPIEFNPLRSINKKF